MKARTARLAGGAMLILALVGSTAGGCFSDSNTVDGKGESVVPGTTPPAVCYFLEVETTSAGGDDKGELTYCASKAEWDANQIGGDWRGADGKLK